MAESPPRIYFHVQPAAGGWIVAGAEAPVAFVFRESAVRAALDAARAAWEDLGQPAGVKLLIEGGDWHVLRAYGPAKPAPIP